MAVGGGGAPAAEGADAGISARVLAAYRAGDAWCPRLRWQLLAGIGGVESGHGTSGGARADQLTVAPSVFEAGGRGGGTSPFVRG